MIVSALIFFDGKTHNKIIKFLKRNLFLIRNKIIEKPIDSSQKQRKVTITILSIFFFFQIIIPFRYVFYPSELFWSEEGYRFSWRVMLVEKIGYTNFKVVNKKSGNSFYIKNGHFLTDLQIKQMSFQPDMILEYAHFLGDHFRSQGYQNIGIYAESYVSLNGRPSQELIDPKVDLLEQEESLKTKKWIKPLNYEIKGF
jgi:hypothetical protein